MDITGGTLYVVAGVLALLLTILTCIFIAPEKKRAGLGKFGKFLHDTVNFKYLIVEKILQFLYIFATAATIVLGILALFAVEKGYSYYSYYGGYRSAPDEWVGYYGLLILIAGPIAVRIVYEFLLMFILLIKNVIQINNKLKASAEPVEPAGEAPAYTAAATPVYTAPAEAEYSQGRTCPECGAKITVGVYCPSCGSKAD